MKKIIMMVVCLIALSLFVVGCETKEDTVNDDVVPIDETQGVAVGEPNPATPDLSEYDVVCTDEQKASDMCTRDYRPVCANDGETYSNGCTACSTPVDAYNAGACGDDGETTQILDHICSDSERTAQICTMEFNPVCGSDGNDYGNGCGACASNNEGWTRGEC